VTEAEIFLKAQTVVADILRVDKDAITRKSSIKEDLGADSLDQVTLLMALEDEFKEEISDDDAKQLVTVGDTVSFITRKLEEKKA
jgi:acyl carrier protein